MLALRQLDSETPTLLHMGLHTVQVILRRHRRDELDELILKHKDMAVRVEQGLASGATDDSKLERRRVAPFQDNVRFSSMVTPLRLAAWDEMIIENVLRKV